MNDPPHAGFEALWLSGSKSEWISVTFPLADLHRLTTGSIALHGIRMCAAVVHALFVVGLAGRFARTLAVSGISLCIRKPGHDSEREQQRAKTQSPFHQKFSSRRIGC
jgi:hypothetical protein